MHSLHLHLVCDSLDSDKPTILRQQQLKDSTESTTPRAIRWAVPTALAIAIVLVSGYLVLLPNMADDLQTFWSTFIGSAVGSLLAVGGAIFIWRVERKLLIADREADFESAKKIRDADKEAAEALRNAEKQAAEALRDAEKEAAKAIRDADIQAAEEVRKADKEAAKLAEQKRSDANNIRQFSATIGNLRALNYHLPDEPRNSTSRERYLNRLRLQELSLTVFDSQLSEELQFMASLAADDSMMDYTIGGHSMRLNTVRDWVLRIITLKPGQSLSSARPDSYESMVNDLKDIDEQRQEEWEARDAWEAEERLKLANAAAVSLVAQGENDTFSTADN